MIIVQPGLKSGKLGDLTVSRNRGGQYLRKRGQPLNPNSTRQRDHRAIMALVTASYRTLTQMQFIAWDRYAKDRGFTDGYRAYVSVNETRVKLGQPMMADPPDFVRFERLNTTGVQAQVGTDSFRLWFENVEDPTPGVCYIVEATPPGCPTPRKRDSEQTFIKAPAALADLRDGALLGRAYLDVYQARVGLPPVGTGIVVRLTQVLEGQRNLPHRFHPVVAAAAL